MFAFIAKHRDIWPLKWMCDALGVSRSGFHAWLNRPLSQHQRRILVHRLLDAIRQFAASPFEDCRKLAKTLDSWQVEIGRMWRFSRSNGITEGFHRKMKLIQRRAFGFRNFENYRRRVRALCA